MKAERRRALDAGDGDAYVDRPEVASRLVEGADGREEGGQVPGEDRLEQDKADRIAGVCDSAAKEVAGPVEVEFNPGGVDRRVVLLPGSTDGPPCGTPPPCVHCLAQVRVVIAAQPIRADVPPCPCTFKQQSADLFAAGRHSL